MPPSPAAPAPAGGAPRDAAGAARREAVRAWNGARDLDEIPARVWARWRGAALARAGVRFAATRCLEPATGPVAKLDAR